MKRLSKIQAYIMIGLISFGILFITIDLLAPVISLSIGYTCIFMSALLMAMECGPQVWYWWVPFGVGTQYNMEEQTYDNKWEDITRWTLENFGDSFKYYNYGNTYYFIRKTDAMAFKLRWET